MKFWKGNGPKTSDFSVSPNNFGLDFGTLDLTITDNRNKQDQKDLLNLPLCRAMYFYIVMCSL